jgi:hypothetical protein
LTTKIFPIVTEGTGAEQALKFVQDRIRSATSLFVQAHSTRAAHTGLRMSIYGTIHDIAREHGVRVNEEEVVALGDIFLLEFGLTPDDRLPNPRTLLRTVSTPLIKAVAETVRTFSDGEELTVQGAAGFIFIENLYRQDLINDWRWTWDSAGTRSGSMEIVVKQPISFVNVTLKIEDLTSSTG